jgi:predicted MFS family arabinose efflux permease
VIEPFAAVAGAIVGWRLVDPPGFATLRRSFSFRAPWLGLAVASLTPIGYALISTAQSRMLRADMHLSEERIATLGGIIDPGSGVLGALLGGILADRIGAKPTIALFMALITGCLVAWGALPGEWPVWLFIAVWTGIFQALVSGYNAALLGLCMSLSNPAIGATQFAVFMAAVNLTYSWTSPAGGAIADHYGYQAMFAVAAVIQLATILVLPALDVGEAERRYRATGVM